MDSKPIERTRSRRIVRLSLIVAAVAALFAPTLWSQQIIQPGIQPIAGACDLTGTWYGGGEVVKYQMTLIPRPAGGEDYTLFFFSSANLAALGWPIGTPASGSVMRRNLRNGATYELFAIALVNTADFPPPAPNIWAVHATGRLTDCNTVVFEYDFFGAYLWSSKIPFLSTPDYVPVPPPFSETYKRMPTMCTQCGQ